MTVRRNPSLAGASPTPAVPPLGPPLQFAPEPSPDVSAVGSFGQLRLPFDTLFQTKAVGILMREPAVLANYVDLLKPTYFESSIHRYAVKLIFDYYRQFRQPPTLPALQVMVTEECKRHEHSDTIKLGLLEVIEDAAKIDLSESAFITKKVVDFCKINALKECTVELADAIRDFELKGDGDFEDITPKMRRLSSIGAPGSPGTDVGAGVDTLTERLQNSEMYSAAMKVPTGVRRLDWSLDGGLAPGEILFVAAGPGVGKSTILLHIAASAIKAGCNVFIATMELKEADYELRLHQHLAGVGKAHVLEGSMRYKERKSYIKSVLAPVKLSIKYFPPSTVTVGGIRNAFSRAKVEGDNGRPWLIVVDYLDKLNLGDSRKDTWELIGVAIDELIALGHEFNSPVCTAAQLTREGYTKVNRSQGHRHAGKEHLGGSFKKAADADVLLTFDQSEMEKGKGIARLRILKLRRGKDGIFSYLIDQRPLMTFVEYDNDQNIITGYSPRQLTEPDPATGLPRDYIELLPAWDQSAPYPDESESGRVKPPAVEVAEYVNELKLSMDQEQSTPGFDEMRQKGEAQMVARSKGQVDEVRLTPVPPRPSSFEPPPVPVPTDSTKVKHYSIKRS